MFKPYAYQKEYTSLPDASSGLQWKKTLTFKLAFKPVISAILISAGAIVMLTKVLIPVVSTYANTDSYAPIISPVDSAKEDSDLSVKSVDENFTFAELDQNSKPTDGSPGITSLAPAEEEFFYLSIPALDITDAKVEINAEDLDPRDALGHYQGSCLPSEGCNSFIFGHSTFTGSRNRYEKGDYTAIFSRLNELEYGDEFFIKYGEEEYRYIVDMSRVQNPEEVKPLGSPYPESLGKHESTVELFTCTPPGTTLYRLSVVGKLVD